MRRLPHDDAIIFGIPFYAIVIAVLLPIVAIYRHTPLVILFAAVFPFVVFVPAFLLAYGRRTDREWPFRLLRWNFNLCVVILIISVVTLFAHRLRG